MANWDVATLFRLTQFSIGIINQYIEIRLKTFTTILQQGGCNKNGLGTGFSSRKILPD